MITVDRQSLIPVLARLMNRLDFLTPSARACIGNAIKGNATTDPEIVTAADIARARSLLSEI